MKGKLFLVFFSFLLLAFGLLVLTEKKDTFQIITLPSIYSIYQTEESESIYVKLLTNQPKSYYFHKDLITNVTIKNHSDFIDMNIKDIHFTQSEYNYQGNSYNLISLELEPSLYIENTEIILENCQLELTYDNGVEIVLDLGSLYLITGENTTDLSLDNLFATHGDIANVDTITGIYIKLFNKSDRNIIIHSIETPGSIHFDTYMLKPVEREVEHYDSVESILLVDDYSHTKEFAAYNQNHLLLSNNSVALFAPLLYNGDISFVYRFPLRVHYEIDGNQKSYIIDDFPYINTPFFKEELEDQFVVHDIYDKN